MISSDNAFATAISPSTKALANLLTSPAKWVRKDIDRFNAILFSFSITFLSEKNPANLSGQMIAGGELKDLADARNCIFESFEIKIYQ